MKPRPILYTLLACAIFVCAGLTGCTDATVPTPTTAPTGTSLPASPTATAAPLATLSPTIPIETATQVIVPTDVPTLLPSETATLEPSPTEPFAIAVIPPIQPAADASGTIFFLSRDIGVHATAKQTSVNSMRMNPSGESLSITQAMFAGLEFGDFHRISPSPDGKYLAVIYDFYVLKIVDLDTGTWLETLTGTSFYDWFSDSRHFLGGGYIVALPGFQEYRLPISPGCPGFGGASVSPDGRKITYTCGGSGYTEQIRVINADGSDDKVLLDGSHPFHVWSPDNKILILMGKVWTFMNSDGVVEKELEYQWGEDHCGITARLEWSPDGRSFLVVCNSFFDATYWIQTPSTKKAYIVWVDATTGQQRRLLPEGNFDYFDPVWSPDGKQIAFVYAINDAQEIWAINADGSNLRQLTNTGQALRYPIWRRP